MQRNGVTASRREGEFKVPDPPFPRLAVSHRGGKSGQEAARPNRKSILPNNIRLRTLLATGFSKWPGGHEEGGQPPGQPRTDRANPGRTEPPDKAGGGGGGGRVADRRGGARFEGKPQTKPQHPPPQAPPPS